MKNYVLLALIFIIGLALVAIILQAKINELTEQLDAVRLEVSEVKAEVADMALSDLIVKRTEQDLKGRNRIIDGE